MFALLLLVALTNVDAACTTVGALNASYVLYGNACNDQYTSNDAQCKPSADCGYKYCCLNKTVDQGGNNYCTDAGGAVSAVCAIPSVNTFMTRCTTNAANISSYGCPCSSNPGTCLPGWQCSIPPTTFSFTGTLGGVSQTVAAYNEAVCWTYPLSYNANSTSNYLSPFGGCTSSGCGNGYNPPMFGVCSSTSDCTYNTTIWTIPTTWSQSNPYKCDSRGTTQCVNRGSCDPVNHVCQSRQFGDANPLNPPAPHISNSAIWYFNSGCSNYNGLGSSC